MLVPVFVALLVVFLLARRLVFGAFFFSTSAFAMAGFAAAGGLIISSGNPVSLRLVTLNELPRVAVQTGFELTTAWCWAKSISIMAHRNDLVELREHIKYELRRGNITAEKATTLNRIIDEIEAAVKLPAEQGAVQQEIQQQALVELTQLQAKLGQTLADIIILATVLGSVSSPEFAGTLIAAKIQVVRLQAEKAAVDGTINEIRQSMKRPKAG